MLDQRAMAYEAGFASGRDEAEAEILSLRAEIERFRGGAWAENTRLREQLSAAEQDARRYRWLNDRLSPAFESDLIAHLTEHLGEDIIATDLSEAIDAALPEAKQ